MLSDDVQKAWRDSQGKARHESKEPKYDITISNDRLYIEIKLDQVPNEDAYQNASLMLRMSSYQDQNPDYRIRRYIDGIHTRVDVDRDLQTIPRFEIAGIKLGRKHLQRESFRQFRMSVIESIIYTANKPPFVQIEVSSPKRNLKDGHIIQALDALGVLYGVNDYSKQQPQLGVSPVR